MKHLIELGKRPPPPPEPICTSLMTHLLRMSFKLGLFLVLIWHTPLKLILSIQRMTKLIPGFAPIINAMVHLNSSQRISMAEVYRRFRALVDTLSDQILYERIVSDANPKSVRSWRALLRLSESMSWLYLSENLSHWQLSHIYITGLRKWKTMQNL